MLEDRVERQFEEYEVAHMLGSLVFRTPQKQAPYLVELNFDDQEVPNQLLEYPTRTSAIEDIFEDSQAEGLVVRVLNRFYEMGYESFIEANERDGRA